LTGIGIGLAGAFILTCVLTSLLYGVATTDPATFVSISLLLASSIIGLLYPRAERPR
jgi:hypothetical protein